MWVVLEFRVFYADPVLEYQTVHDGNKHVVVYFYAPWSGECKDFDNEFDKIAFHYKATRNVPQSLCSLTRYVIRKGSENIVVAKMDGDANSGQST